jgi:hypothetical protein
MNERTKYRSVKTVRMIGKMTFPMLLRKVAPNLFFLAMM